MSRISIQRNFLTESKSQHSDIDPGHARTTVIEIFLHEQKCFIAIINNAASDSRHSAVNCRIKIIVLVCGALLAWLTMPVFN